MPQTKVPAYRVNLPKVVHNDTKLEGLSNCLIGEFKANTRDIINLLQPLSKNTAVYMTVDTKSRKPFMIDALAENRQSLCRERVAANVRGADKLVLIVASTGIAALQLPRDAAHNIFTVPFDEYLNCVQYSG